MSKRLSSPIPAPGRAGLNPVLPRDGLVDRPTLVWRRRWGLYRALVHQTQHHSPRTCGGGAAPAGGRRRASRRLNSVRTPCGWLLGPARGEFLAPNSPLVPPCRRRISGPPRGSEIRWILSVGWCPSKRVVVIHYTRPHTAHKIPDGRLGAISGSASKFAEDTCYENGAGRKQHKEKIGHGNMAVPISVRRPGRQQQKEKIGHGSSDQRESTQPAPAKNVRGHTVGMEMNTTNARRTEKAMLLPKGTD
jgi:hypothetical protein